MCHTELAANEIIEVGRTSLARQVPLQLSSLDVWVAFVISVQRAIGPLQMSVIKDC